MIDFSSAISKKTRKVYVEPCELYESLDRSSEAGPLRPSQISVLSKWHKEYRTNKDIIIKLGTGIGKTLVGLLTALSYMNEEKRPSLYVCPNIYLFQQTCAEARKFGIPFCIIDETNSIPDEFYNSEKVLITYVQKVFNGKTIFGIDNKSIDVGAFVLDDSHACIDSISSSCTIKITRKRNPEAYNSISEIFEPDLINQGRGTFQEIQNENSDAMLMIPYWAWSKHIENVTKIISKIINSNEKIMFPWQILKDCMIKCDAYISSKEIEISPDCLPIKRFGSFERAKHRILMSATTQNDSFFVKNFGLTLDSVRNPIVDNDYTWSGEKMILIPSLMNSELNNDDFINFLINNQHKDFGIVVLTPSFEKSSKYAGDENAIVVNNSNKNNMYEIITKYKNIDYKHKYLVLANRYDGIDLPDNSCRLLVIDSLPCCEALNERYEETCRNNSDIINIKIAQKIEQALGRSVRGEKDYSVIIITGSSLIKFLQTSTNRKYFSPQTRKQIEIGFEIIKMSLDDSAEIDKNYIVNTIKQCVGRDHGWKEYYQSQMEQIDSTEEKTDILSVLEAEKIAYDYYLLDDYKNACEYIEKICNTYGNSDFDKDNEHSWYLQKLAKYKYQESEIESKKIQKRAFEKNQQLLKPIGGVQYKKIKFPIDDNRIQLMSKRIQAFKKTEDFRLYMDELFENIKFGINHSIFEKSIDDLGTILGFVCQRPDLTIDDGPDNLWCISKTEYIAIECKSEVNVSRSFISKDEAGQLDQHFGWFNDEYKFESYRNIIIIPSDSMDKKAHFTRPIFIINKNGLHHLVTDLKKMFLEFYKYDVKSISNDTIFEIIAHHNFAKADFLDRYSIMI